MSENEDRQRKHLTNTDAIKWWKKRTAPSFFLSPSHSLSLSLTHSFVYDCHQDCSGSHNDHSSSTNCFPSTPREADVDGSELDHWQVLLQWRMGQGREWYLWRYQSKWWQSVGKEQQLRWEGYPEGDHICCGSIQGMESHNSQVSQWDLEKDVWSSHQVPQGSGSFDLERDGKTTAWIYGWNRLWSFFPWMVLRYLPVDLTLITSSQVWIISFNYL